MRRHASPYNRRFAASSSPPAHSRELVAAHLRVLNDARQKFGGAGTELPYWAARIDGQRLKSLFKIAGCQPQLGHLLGFRNDVEMALTQYVTDNANAPFKLLPSQLTEKLKAIERAALDLSALLAGSPEAQDAMVRVHRPESFPKSALFAGATAPPDFTTMALDVSEAARVAQHCDQGKLPYVRFGRDQVVLKRLLAALIEAWDSHFTKPATFNGVGKLSPFVKFIVACLAQIGVTSKSAEALAKSCARIAAQVRTSGPVS
jgi:hypothetical protein